MMTATHRGGVHGYDVRRNALTILEVVVVTLIITGLMSLIPVVGTLSRPQDMSRTASCRHNLKSLGRSMRIYAQDNNWDWPVPAFDQTAIGMIDYTVPTGGGTGTRLSPDRTMPSASGSGGAREISATRALWMLVRSGDVSVDQLVCPLSDDTPDPTQDVLNYYDFADLSHVSYGLQVPFGPPGTRASNVMDARVAIAAEKGPYSAMDREGPPASLRTSNDPDAWRAYNSPNHGGAGQHVLFADGHVDYYRTPVVGLYRDNIYTVSTDAETQLGRTIGEPPWQRHALPYTLTDQYGRSQVSTDSVIYP